MTKLLSAAALAIALAAPAVASAQQGQAQQTASPSNLAAFALEVRQELRLSPEQVTRLEGVRDSLKEAHRVHCGPMHATTPTPAQEEAHHREMKEIGDRAHAQAATVLTPAQRESVARLHAARAAAKPAGEHSHGEGHGAGHGADGAAQDHAKRDATGKKAGKESHADSLRDEETAGAAASAKAGSSAALPMTNPCNCCTRKWMARVTYAGDGVPQASASSRQS